MDEGMRIAEVSIDDLVERWHKGDSEIPLEGFLGMSDQEYHAFALHGTVPDRFALFAAQVITNALAEKDAEIARLREVLVVAMIPIEAVLLSGSESAHCQEVRDALHEARNTTRQALEATNGTV